MFIIHSYRHQTTMKISRQLQLSILKALQDIYPDALLVQNLPGFAMDKIFMGNLFYLREHGLIRGGDIREPGQCRSMIDAEITKDGLDLLENDGGINAIIDHHTLSIPKAEIIAKLMTRLHETSLETEKVTTIKSQLESLPNEKLVSLFKEILLEAITTSPKIMKSFLLDK